MGKRKYLIASLFCFTCLVHTVDATDIVSDIYLDTEGIVLRFTEMDVFDLIDMTGIEIFNEDYSYNVFIAPDSIEMVNEDTILINLLGKRFIPNKHYHIIINMKNYYIHLFTFWGNPLVSLENYYLFPLFRIPNVKISVDRQRAY